MTSIKVGNVHITLHCGKFAETLLQW